MPDVREKLVELVKEGRYCPADDHPFDSCEKCDYLRKDDCQTERVVDNLIANDVTIQRWIPVTERLPEESGMYIVTANDGHAQRVSFVLWQKRNKAWNLTGARSYWRVTHWMPLPQPPKGE